MTIASPENKPVSCSLRVKEITREQVSIQGDALPVRGTVRGEALKRVNDLEAELSRICPMRYPVLSCPIYDGYSCYYMKTVIRPDQC